jgi:hypothetical protein
METLESLAAKMQLPEKELQRLRKDPHTVASVNKIISFYTQAAEKQARAVKAYEAYKESPFLKNSSEKLSIAARINREYIIRHEIGQRINEVHGTMFYFKERTKELAHIAGLDPSEIRLAFGEGIQNVLEHGKSKSVEIRISVHNINTEDVFLEMSFKHYMPTKAFYSIQSANRNADEGISNIESSRGRGEFLMREIMDERKFLNGVYKHANGDKEYFFQRIMKKYKFPKTKQRTHKLTHEFKNYIDTLTDYDSALFVRMDYFEKKKELVLSENSGSLAYLNQVMDKYGYVLTGTDNYRSTNFTFWENELTEREQQNEFENILAELGAILAGKKIQIEKKDEA